MFRVLIILFTIIFNFSNLLSQAKANHNWEFGIKMRDHGNYIRVLQVRANSVAEKSGIKEGDDIIGLNNTKVINIKNFKSIFLKTKSDHQHSIVIRRYGKFVGGSKNFLIKIDLDKEKFKIKKDEIYSTLSRCKTNVLNNCYHEQKLDDGTYYGDWKNNKFHGDGKLVSKNGDQVIIGQFLNGKVHGYATYKSKNDQIYYEGYWRNGEFNGLGTRYWENGKEFYKGNWKNSKFHGQGYYRFEDGSSIDGEWLNGSINGFAKRVWKTNDGERRYEGNFLNDNRSGKGRFVDTNGSVLSGVWKDDEFMYGYDQEYEMYSWKNGDYYKGEFKNELPNGKGVIRSKNKKEIYNGYVKNGKKHGDGQFTENGFIYVGEFFEDLKNGNGELISLNDGKILKVGIWDNNTFLSGYNDGKYYFKNGDEYTGEFVKYSPSGNGKINFKNGNIYQGEVLDGQLNGKGVLSFSNGDIFEGIFKKGKKESGIFKYASGEFYQGKFLENYKHGQGKYKLSNGDELFGVWEEDKIIEINSYKYSNGDYYVGEFLDKNYKSKNLIKNGNGILTFSNGDKYDGIFLADKFNGKGIYTWGNGDRYDGEWKNGEKIGYGLYNYANGNKKEVFTYDNGDVLTGKFVNGLLEGEGLLTSSVGKKKFIGNFKLGKRNGLGATLLIKDNAEIKLVADWENDKRVKYYFSTNLDSCHYKNIELWDNCYGKEVFTDNSRYIGHWKNNKQDGRGILFWANKDKYEGDFVNGKFNGKGIFSWANGDKYEGDFVNDRFEGKGIFSRTNGEIYEGDFVNGNKTGLGIYLYSNGSTFNGKWEKNKKLDGEYIKNLKFDGEYIEVISKNANLVKSNKILKVLTPKSKIYFKDILNLDENYISVNYDGIKGLILRDPDDTFKKINIKNSYLPFHENITEMVKTHNKINETNELISKLENTDWYNLSDKHKLKNAKELLPSLRSKIKYEEDEVLQKIKIKEENEKKRLAKIKEEKKRRDAANKKANEEVERQLRAECNAIKYQIKFYEGAYYDLRRLMRSGLANYNDIQALRAAEEGMKVWKRKWRHQPPYCGTRYSLN